MDLFHQSLGNGLQFKTPNFYHRGRIYFAFAWNYAIHFVFLHDFISKGKLSFRFLDVSDDRGYLLEIVFDTKSSVAKNDASVHF